jgi:hypothetical protein
MFLSRHPSKCSPSLIHGVLHPRGRLRETDNRQKSVSTAFLPYMQNLSNCAGRMLVWYNIKTIHLPLPKPCSIFRLVKDTLESTRSPVNVGPCILVRWAARLKNVRWSTRETFDSTVQNARHWQSIQSTRSTECTFRTHGIRQTALLHQQSYLRSRII